MACNNKGFHTGCNLPYCKITNGECQFITHEEICPMRDWRIEDEVKKEDKPEALKSTNKKSKLNEVFSSIGSLFRR